MELKVNLFINYYQDKNSDRQLELEICVLSNILNKKIDTINIVVANNDLVALIKMKEKLTSATSKGIQDKIHIIPFEQRPTYNNYFKFTEKYPNDINIISNKDMIMDADSLQKLKKWNWENRCLALSRWDFINHNLDIKEAVHFNRADSQDTWMVKGSFKQCNGNDFGLAIAGCDNKIALMLSEHYDIINPSLDVKAYHYHISNIRNYTNINNLPIERIQPPYKLITPPTLTL